MSSRRAFLAATSGGLATAFFGCSATTLSSPPAENRLPPFAGATKDGRPAGALGIDPAVQYPDVRSYRKKLGLLLPATNTTMEHELWSLLVRNSGGGVDGVGLHTTVVLTPRPILRTAADVEDYKRQFTGGLDAAVSHALLAKPELLVMGMSLEHILRGLDAIRATTATVTAKSGLTCITWHDAASTALHRFGAKRIGLLTPFEATGNENAARLFRDLGFEVVSSVGLACPDAVQIAHVPDFAKERAIVELLATRENRLDAVVQCGTNMGMTAVAEKLEPQIGIPILGINATLLWHALRQSGISTPLSGGGRVLRELT